MTKKFAFVFPGQGSQYVGMGKALCEAFVEAKDVFHAADDALHEKLSSICFEGPDEKLKLTATTQPAILTVSMAVHAVFSKAMGESPTLMAGHSLGEYSALVSAGAMPLGQAVTAVRARGTFMQDAVKPGVGAMAAVLGLSIDKIREVCAEAAQGEVVSVANLNEPMQTVIAGHSAAVARAETLLKAAGAKRTIALAVSAPFHCALMEPVVAQLDPILSAINFGEPRVPVVSNVEATPNRDSQRIRELLLRQVTAPVRWTECIAAMEREGVEQIFELGPGKVLCGLVKRISKSIECTSVEDPASLEKALAHWQKTKQGATA